MSLTRRGLLKLLAWTPLARMVAAALPVRAPLASPPLTVDQSVVNAMTSVRQWVHEEGLSIRFLRSYAINADRMPTRFDCLYGVGVIRPELACRVVTPIDIEGV